MLRRNIRIIDGYFKLYTIIFIVPEENIVQNCTDVAMPVCAVDQVVKMELTLNGCKRFICGKH